MLLPIDNYGTTESANEIATPNEVINFIVKHKNFNMKILWENEKWSIYVRCRIDSGGILLKVINPKPITNVTNQLVIYGCSRKEYANLDTIIPREGRKYIHIGTTWSRSPRMNPCEDLGFLQPTDQLYRDDTCHYIIHLDIAKMLIDGFVFYEHSSNVKSILVDRPIPRVYWIRVEEL